MSLFNSLRDSDNYFTCIIIIQFNQQSEGSQTNLLSCQKQRQFLILTPSQKQKQGYHSKHNECLQSSDKGICHDQEKEKSQNVQYTPEQKS